MTLRGSLTSPRALAAVIMVSGVMSGAAIAASGIALSNTTHQAHVACVTVDQLRSDLVTVLSIAAHAPESEKSAEARQFYTTAIRRLKPIRCTP